MAEYLERLRIQSFAEESVQLRDNQLGYFANWCEERAVTRAREVTKYLLEDYQSYLFYYRKTNGMPLGISTQYNRLNVVRCFFRWLAREDRIPFNPASELMPPRQSKRLPRDILSIPEVEAVLAQADATTWRGIRDRAMMEVFYSTGMRRKELRGLALYDIDVARGTVMIREGKGRKDRVVPIGRRALHWLDRYQREVRPRLVIPPDSGAVFLSVEGTISNCMLTTLMHGYVKAADLGKKGSCHIFRHTMATHMLEGGADIRFIQQMLGHAELTSTQVYTHVSIGELKRVHATTHPVEKRDAPDGAAPPGNATSDGATSDLRPEAK
jgi:integrase/recombinase XerD